MDGERRLVTQPSPPIAFERLDARGGYHPPVAHHHHVVQPGAFAHALGSGDEGSGVGGVAGEDLYGNRPALGAADEAVLDLGLCPSWRHGSGRAWPVGSGCPPPRNWTGHRAPCPRGQVPAGQGGLDVALAGAESVHGGVDLVGRDLGEAQVGGHGGPLPPPGGGSLGARFDSPGRRAASARCPSRPRPPRAGARGWPGSRSSPCRPGGTTAGAAWLRTPCCA